MNVTFVVGPTASGKSELALRLAEAHNGVIVNCDSVQVYAHVQIGAAKPSVEDLKRVPHYLYGYVLPPDESTAGTHRRQVMDLLSSLEAQGVSDVYLVGGTGFYFQAIEKGMFSVEKVDPAIAAQLMVEAGTAEGLLRLHRELENADPASAERIHRNDQYRIVRALEIVRGTGRRPSDLLQEKQTGIEPFPYPLRKLGVHWERSELHTRIHRRVKQMLKQGFIDEVVSLNKMNLQNWAPMQSVGYKEVQQYLVGEIKTHDALEEKILISTRQLAKRQVTWFRRDAEIDWVSL